VPGSGSRSSVKEVNVIGTMQLLGACQKAPSVRRLVVKSTTSVYGGAPRDPAVFDESTPAKSLPSGGFAKDAVEVEGYVRGFARRRPDVSVAVLRFAHVLGPSVESPLAAYFALPVLPTVLGYDPRLQFVHEDDAVEVLRLAAREPRRGTLNAGTFNIAGDGALLLSQCARRLGRPTVPLLLPAIRWGRSLLQSVGATDFSPEQVRLLTHGRVVRTVQMRETLGFEPRYTTAQTLAAFAESRGQGLLPPETLARAVDKLAEMVRGQPEGERQDEEVGTHG
jgi:UDP-glucose 4-epimerase